MIVSISVIFYVYWVVFSFGTERRGLTLNSFLNKRVQRIELDLDFEPCLLEHVHLSKGGGMVASTYAFQC